ncbi:MAG: RNA pseudouridine synthase [Bacteroidetes bacterium]|nr:MAG: RNA pseudouridine synthase [Bacteroidota bacterium]
MKFEDKVLYEDNHLLIVNKAAGDIVQGDKTGDTPLSEYGKTYLKEKYDKPGNVYLGVVHRLDRPTSGALIMARTDKALSRLNKMLTKHEIKKVYWAIVEKAPKVEASELINFIKKNPKNNKSYVVTKNTEGAKEAILNYKLMASSDKYHLLEVILQTGRHHQIRTQLSNIGCIIKGDLKYGSKRNNKDASISLHARHLSFIHPVKKNIIEITAPIPKDKLWEYFEQNTKK